MTEKKKEKISNNKNIIYWILVCVAIFVSCMVFITRSFENITLTLTLLTPSFLYLSIFLLNRMVKNIEQYKKSNDKNEKDSFLAFIIFQGSSLFTILMVTLSLLSHFLQN